MIVLGHGFSDRRVGNINAEFFTQRLQNVIFALENKKVQTVVVRLHGDLHVFIEEILLALIHGVKQLHVFNAAVDHGAAVRGDETIGKVVAALHGSFQKGTAVFAEKAGQIVGGHFHGAGARRPEPGGKCALKVQKRFRCVLAHISHAFFAFAAGLNDKLVVCLLKEVFKVAQIL